MSVNKLQPKNMPLYLDYNATTPCDELVLAEMLPFFCQHFGNAASISSQQGFKAHLAVERSREQIAQLLHAQANEIIFTSGATESNNLGLRGVYAACRDGGNHIISSSIEHPATLATLKELEREGARVSLIKPLPDGGFDLDALQALITPETILISVMYANNELGVVNPIAEIAAIAERHNILLMSDATQAAGKVPIDVRQCPIDILTCSAHKIYGPKGIGALYLRRKNGKKIVDLHPQITGGNSEQGMRGGTLNVPGIVGFGKAAELAAQRLPQAMAKAQAQRDRLEQALAQWDNVQINGSGCPRLPHVSNISFKQTDGARLLNLLKKSVSVSTGSACSSSSLSPSHVLTELGLSEELAQATLRFSLGWPTTDEDIDVALAAVNQALNMLSSAYAE
ncbi:cysteine desulfurase family protein [Serratia rubidaea]|uniref:cysteine desulfurase n=1 Tax=Serratia rubidaea TaxID=61652 RepID=A0A448SCA2_SERRU|nr:cysteine desulfurase family protein [Serratia rubidaea]MBH1930312.1 cysteine desulfurase [Serratia rubidaea]MDC6117416.1 cysteine desulfurase family protein [Serratia rubidaea]VEI65311.1 Cysteine desulfurase [Serratia rubidaea]